MDSIPQSIEDWFRGLLVSGIMDKMNESGLTPVQTGGSMSFKEAEITLVCRKLFKQQLDVANMPEDVAKTMYEGQAPHDMYIGEIVDIIRKD